MEGGRGRGEGGGGGRLLNFSLLLLYKLITHTIVVNATLNTEITLAGERYDAR